MASAAVERTVGEGSFNSKIKAENTQVLKW